MNVNLGKGFGPLDFDENGKMVKLKLNSLKYLKNVCEGSVLIKKNGRYEVDEEETKFQRQKMFELQNDVFNKDS